MAQTDEALFFLWVRRHSMACVICVSDPVHCPVQSFCSSLSYVHTCVDCAVYYTALGHLSFPFFLQLSWPTSLPRLMDYRKKQRRLPVPSTYHLTRYTIWGAFGGGHKGAFNCTQCCHCHQTCTCNTLCFRTCPVIFECM